MKNSKLQQLICKMIDKTVTADEAREWNDYIARHPRADEMYRAQQQMSRLLDTMPQIDPPSGLHSDIMAAIPLVEKRAVADKGWRRILPAPVLPPRYRFAYGFAAGMVVGLLVFFILLSGNNADTFKNESLIGTALFSRQFQMQRIDRPSVTGEIAWRIERQQQVVRLSLHPAEPITAELVFDPDKVRLRHYYQESGDNAGDVIVQPGVVQIDFIEHNRLVVILENRSTEASPVQFSIIHQGNLLFARPLNAPLLEK